MASEANYLLGQAEADLKEALGQLGGGCHPGIKLGGSLRPLLNDGYLKQMIMLILKHMDGPFSMFVNRTHVFNIFEQISLAPPPEAPSGRGSIFSNIWKTEPLFKKMKLLSIQIVQDQPFVSK